LAIQSVQPEGQHLIDDDQPRALPIPPVLRDSELQLRQIVENTPVVLFALDRDGIFTLSEGKALQALGLKSGEVVGRSALEMYRDHPAASAALTRALAGEEFTVVTHAHGRAYETCYSPLRTATGEFAGTIGVAIDVTERSQAELQVRRYAEIVEHIDAGLYVHRLERTATGSTLRCVSANPASERMTGISACNYVGRTIDEVYPALRQTGFIDFVLQAVDSGQPVVNERFRYGDDNVAEAEWSWSIFPLANEHVAVMFQDVTVRVQAEQQMRRLLAELAHVERVSTIGEMASGLAHEINQPLAAIGAYVDACLELVASGRIETEQLVSVLRSVSAQADRAGQIIHRLRRMIKRSHPAREPMSVNDAVREVTGLIEPRARQAGISIYLDLTEGLPQLTADYLQVRQVILNLIQNGFDAMQNCPPERRHLAVATRLAGGKELETSVCDWGHGLSEQSAKRLFEPFFSTRPDGLGLGLSISRTIVEAHGGRIWVTSNSEQGVTAHFSLPIAEGQAGYDADTDSLHR
jgi:PAS domain S-box-containing protein